MMEETPFHEWTACEVYGHEFTDGAGERIDHCCDCGEPAVELESMVVGAECDRRPAP